MLWVPILEALRSLPDTPERRAEPKLRGEDRPRRDFGRYSVMYRRGVATWAGDVSPESSAVRSPVFTCEGGTFRNTPLVPCHTKRPSPLTWYPGMPIRRWKKTAPTGIWQVAFGLGHEPNNYLRFASKHAGKRSLHTDDYDMESAALKTREVSGLESGERWFFEHAVHGSMISSPLIRRDF